MPSLPPKHKPGFQRPKVATSEAPAPKRHDTRLSARQRGYDTAWEKARKGYLQHHPLCVHCLAEGIVTAATVVDHIDPHRGDMVKFWDSTNNWQALCATHHSRATAKYDGGFGNARKEGKQR